jgi:predicted MFS family arabinose efflux permease
MEYFKKTRLALLSSSLLNEPLTLFYVWLPFILRKDLGASPFQIALFIMLKPAMSLISFYWSASIEKRRGKLRSNLVISGLLARLPFILCFFIDNSWFLLFASAIHMLFLKGGLPAWMEILKLNLPKDKRDRLFSLSSTIGYLEGVLLALSIGTFLDSHHASWKMFALGSSLLGLVAVLIQWRIPIRREQKKEEPLNETSHALIKPWKTTLSLMKTRPDFADFQWGFMIGGFGIILVTATLPLFFVDVLHLSHTHFAAARSVCMGLGFALSSSLWARALNLFAMPRLTALICLGFGIFPLILMGASLHLAWLYVAYIVYGITQGGSHIVWHLSGPLFSKREDSSQYSGANLCMSGVRGLIAPLIAHQLCSYIGPEKVLISGALICMSGTLFALTRKKYATRSN